MPLRPLRACSIHGCPHLTRERYCASHMHRVDEERAAYEKKRAQAHQRGYDTEWREYRGRFLHAHPYCADPYKRHVGERVDAHQVDHVVPHKGDRRLFWDPRNHQSLCESCGGYKSAVEEGGRAHSTRPPTGAVSGMQGPDDGCVHHVPTTVRMRRSPRH